MIMKKILLVLALLFAGCVSEAPREVETVENHTEYKLYPGDMVVQYELREVNSDAVFCRMNDCRHLKPGDSHEYAEGKCIFVTDVSGIDRYVKLYLAPCPEE
jgi:hypothetical protein